MYEALILIPPSEHVTLDRAYEAVTTYFEKQTDPHSRPQISVDDDALFVTWDSYTFRVIANTSSYVKVESSEIAEHFGGARDDRAEISACPARYRLVGSAPDPNMDHFNHYLYLTHAFEAAFKRVFIFDPNSGEFFS